MLVVDLRVLRDPVDCVSIADGKGMGLRSPLRSGSLSVKPPALSRPEFALQPEPQLEL